MKSRNPLKSDRVYSNSVSPKNRTSSLRLFLSLGAVLILAGLLASGFSWRSSASSPNKASSDRLVASNEIRAIAAGLNSLPLLTAGNYSNLFTMPQGPGVSVATYAGDCTTPKTVFNLQDTDLTVCAKVTGANPNWRIIWSNAHFTAVQNVPLGTGENTFTLTAASSLGDWRVIAFEPLGGSVYGIIPFTVVDAANPSADLAISKSPVVNPIAVGAQAVFGVQVTNFGPSDAAGVQITDSIPANTTFASFAQIAGPAGFNCVLPTVGSSTGDTICTIPNLAKGETALFVAAYDLIAGVQAGMVISNVASVSSTGVVAPPADSTPDPNIDNNSSAAYVDVTGATSETCVLDCPANVVVTADTTSGGQPGAFVSFGAASVREGNCGSLSNNPPSGSFFAVGTHSILSVSETGPTCTFTVTVLDSNPPTITCPPNITATAPTGATDYILPSGPGTPTINASGGGTVTGVRSDNIAATYDENGNVVTPAVVHDVVTDPYPIGTTGILWTVTDAGGRTASCTQTITILAAGVREPVTISCPANVSVTAPGGSCQATVSAATISTPTTNPSDSDVSVSSQRSDGEALSDPFPVGTTVITWTATDDITNTSASCAQTVTVTVSSSGDTTPPTLVVPPNVTTTTSSCTATLDDELGTAEASDPAGTCNGSVTITRTGVPANFVFPTGTTTIIYTATDAAGNSTQGLQLVTVLENTPPSITAPASLLTLDTGGVGGTSCGKVVNDATLGTATASDNCPGVTVARTGVPAGNNFPVGDTIITYTATDASGNTAQAFQTIRVTDNTPPVITSVPSGGQTDAGSCSATIPNVATGTVASDNCAILSKTQSPAAGTAVGLGTHTITVTVTDVNGNSSQAQTTFTVNALQFETKFWLGLKNSDDVGTKFDLRAEVRKNGVLVGSAEIYGENGGSSGFNNASLRTINAALSSTGFCSGDALSVTLLVRVAANSGHVSGTARLWYNDSVANSRFNKIVNGVPTTDYLRKIGSNLVLVGSTGPLPKLTIDVLVNRNQNGNPFKPFGTWTKTF